MYKNKIKRKYKRTSAPVQTITEFTRNSVVPGEIFFHSDILYYNRVYDVPYESVRQDALINIGEASASGDAADGNDCHTNKSREFVLNCSD